MQNEKLQMMTGHGGTKGTNVADRSSEMEPLTKRRFTWRKKRRMQLVDLPSCASGVAVQVVDLPRFFTGGPTRRRILPVQLVGLPSFCGGKKLFLKGESKRIRKTTERKDDE